MRPLSQLQHPRVGLRIQTDAALRSVFSVLGRTCFTTHITTVSRQPTTCLSLLLFLRVQYNLQISQNQNNTTLLLPSCPSHLSGLGGIEEYEKFGTESCWLTRTPVWRLLGPRVCRGASSLFRRRFTASLWKDACAVQMAFSLVLLSTPLLCCIFCPLPAEI